MWPTSQRNLVQVAMRPRGLEGNRVDRGGGEGDWGHSHWLFRLPHGTRASTVGASGARTRARRVTSEARVDAMRASEGCLGDGDAGW